jgi:hypothetical protein
MFTHIILAQPEYVDHRSFARPLAQQMFNHSRSQARLMLLKALFTGKLRMLSLSQRLAGRGIQAQHDLGNHCIEIKQIVGTESRADDFDAEFHPRDDRIRSRWVNIAEQRLRRNSLPAVDLIQVGHEYFVRDGHHRISVARALGNAFIDARVTVWELE